MASLEDTRRKEFAVLATPAVLFVGAFCIAPLALLFLYSFYRVDFVAMVPDLNLRNYATVVTSETYRTLIGKAMLHGALVAGFTAVLAYPLAFFIAMRVKVYKAALLTALLIPLYTGDLVRIFAWRVVLGAEGILNTFLLWIGATEQPIMALLFSTGASLLVLTYNYLPFMVLAIWIALELLDRSLLEAAADLGAGRFRTFRHVVLPLTLPGVLVGALMVFALVIGDYLTPQLIGGSSGVTVISAIHDLFGAAFDWPLGGAIAWVLMAVLVTLIAALATLALRSRLGRALLRTR